MSIVSRTVILSTLRPKNCFVYFQKENEIAPPPFPLQTTNGLFREEVWGWTLGDGCFTFYKLLLVLDCGVCFTLTDF